LKIPQITSILKEKSVSGISIGSAYLDFLNVYFLFMYSFNKNLNAKVWGEYLCIGLQNLLIVLLYWYFEKKDVKNTVCEIRSKFYTRLCGVFFSVLVFSIGMLTDFYPNWVWVSFALTNIPTVLFSRLFQIITLIKTKNPGSLSPSTFTMRYLKNFMQAFYLYIQVGDNILIFNQIYNGCLSLLVYVLIIYYTRKSKQEKNLKKD